MEREEIRFKDYLKDYLDFNNISSKDFANRIGITPKHLSEILSGESDISLNIAENISIVTQIPIEYILKIEQDYRLENKIDYYLLKNNIRLISFLNRFDYKELEKMDYLTYTDRNDKKEILKDILKFLRVNDPKTIYELEMSNIYFKSNNNKQELLLLWLEKCYKESLKQTVSEYKNNNINTIVNYIQESAYKSVFKINELIRVFNENGIYLVIQEDLPNSKIRGAFKVNKDKPAVYLTLKHKRIADIYFALLHELAHCKTDFNKAKANSLISTDNENDELEQKADKQAFNWMVDDHYYNGIKNNIDYKIEKEKKYPKSFIVYRLAMDGLIKYGSSEYQKYNKMILK
jgi:HTH-type transcriptional regulator/antitoxin HigA